MVTPALKAIKKLELTADRQATLDMCVKTFGANSGALFEIGLSSWGIEASRSLSAFDLVDIRDWINEALAAYGGEA